MLSPRPASPRAVALYMAFNFISSVGIINLNKSVFKTHGFAFPTALTALHFIVTFAGLIVCNMAGMFQIKHVPLRHIVPLSLSFTGFVIFNNLSLQYNSLGFYQLMKVLTTPAIVAIQLWFFNVPLHPRLRLALLPICVGVALATVSDVEVNALGTVFALLGIASTSMYQLWVKTKQQDLGLDSYQLLFLQAPTSAVLVLAISFITEPWGFAFDASPVSAGADPTPAVSILSYPYTFESSCAILGTGVLSFCVNLSIFLVIGKTSPVAYNVLGHFKLVCILLSGLVLFGEDAGAAKLLGTALTLGGVLAYTHWQQNLKSGWEGRDKAAKEEPDVAVLVPTSPSAATGAALGPRGLEFASLSRPLVVDAEQTQTLSARFDGSDAVQRPATKL